MGSAFISRCIDITTGSLQLVTGIMMICIEAAIIKMDPPDAPANIKLIRQEVVAKAAVHSLGGLLYIILLFRSNSTKSKLRLIISSANFLNLCFMIWQCAFGLNQVLTLCEQYPDACEVGGSLYYNKLYLIAQESMFDTGTLACLIGIVLSYRQIGKDNKSVYASIETAEFSPSHEDHEETIHFIKSNEETNRI